MRHWIVEDTENHGQKRALLGQFRERQPEHRKSWPTQKGSVPICMEWVETQ
jgi:hypothetical protein